MPALRLRGRTMTAGPATRLIAAEAVEAPTYVRWTTELAGAERWRDLPPVTATDREFLDPALDVLAVAPHGEVRYAALDGRHVRIVKGHPPIAGQRRLF